MESTLRSVSFTSLAAAFASVPDPRRQASVTYPLGAILTLAVSAILANHASILVIAEWGTRQSADVLTRLGFPSGRAPCQSTVQRLFAKLDGHVRSAVLTAHFVQTAGPATGEVEGIATDGKACRGRLQFDDTGCPCMP